LQLVQPTLEKVCCNFFCKLADDADGIAGWLRENVAFEPTTQEALAVAEILQQHLDSTEDLPGTSQAILSEVIAKFGLYLVPQD
jgi:hypothetical protein